MGDRYSLITPFSTLAFWAITSSPVTQAELRDRQGKFPPLVKVIDRALLRRPGFLFQLLEDIHVRIPWSPMPYPVPLPVLT